VNNVEKAPSVPRLAATVMIVRDEPHGMSVYLTRRSARSRFMPDAYVFPGGAVDAADAAPEARARLIAGGPRNGALVVAAAREVFEEAGLLLARRSDATIAPPDATVLADLREALAAGTPFAALLQRAGLVIDAADIVPYSQWITPESEPLRFDTHFFIARAPAGQVAAADAIEVHDGRWMRPRDALGAAGASDIVVRYPTRKHLERLAGMENVAAALAAARMRRMGPVLAVERDGTIDLGACGDDW